MASRSDPKMGRWWQVSACGLLLVALAALTIPLHTADANVYPPQEPKIFETRPLVPGDENWSSDFGLAGTDTTIHAIARDSSGNLYAGGDFTWAGGQEGTHRVAKWNAATNTWSSLGTGMNSSGTVWALAVDASGNLYAGGDFISADGVSANRVAKWNGTTWSALGTGMNGSVRALVTDASGNLYAGGQFTTAGGVTVNYIAKWNALTSSWEALGTGATDLVSALALDGGGNLFAGGAFTTIGGVSASRIAKWDGANWSALGAGVVPTGPPIYVWALTFASGNLYAGGDFTTAGGVTVNRIARWDGANWNALGTGADNTVRALAIDASGNLFAGGAFTTIGGVSASRIAKWDGANWSALGTGVGTSVNQIVRSIQSNGTDNIFAGGWFVTAGGSTVNYVANWNGATWSSLGTGNGLWGGSVDALAVDGIGNVYAVGNISKAGSVGANDVVKWNGTSWTALPSYFFEVSSATVDGGNNLYVGGSLAPSAIIEAAVAKWDGASWTAVGPNLCCGNVQALARDSIGNLYAGGDFFLAPGSVFVNSIAKWNGVSWLPLGNGFSSAGWYSAVLALAVDASDNVYAGGFFTNTNGVEMNYIAKWNGTSWSALGSGMNGPVRALALDGSGNLYAGGDFTTAGGVSAMRVAKWNGTSWSALGSGVNGGVQALAWDGGNNIYVGGYFTTAGCVVSPFIAKYNAPTNGWAWMGKGTDAEVFALEMQGSSLFVGGQFAKAGGKASVYIGKWDLPAQSANLAITKTDNKTNVAPSASNTYTITVTNSGPNAATGVKVSDVFTTALTSVSWTCSTSGGSSCGNVSGSGNISTTVNLAFGGTATFVATGAVSAGAQGTLVNTVTVDAPFGVDDPNMCNNYAMDSDSIGAGSLYLPLVIK